MTMRLRYILGSGALILVGAVAGIASYSQRTGPWS